jgi:hypothetical protein
MYISRHVRFHEHVFSFDKSEQIAQVSAQTHTPSPVTILPNLTHSPLFTDYTTPHPASASASALPSPYPNTTASTFPLSLTTCIFISPCCCRYRLQISFPCPLARCLC